MSKYGFISDPYFPAFRLNIHSECGKIRTRNDFVFGNFSRSADYTNLHFKNYISDKDINEKILTENPVQSDLQEVTILDDFVKTLFVTQTVITNHHQMRKFQEKVLLVMGPLSRLWKGLEDVRNESSEAVEVTVDTCYIDRTNHTSIGLSITINLVCTSLKHVENIAERSP